MLNTHTMKYHTYGPEVRWLKPGELEMLIKMDEAIFERPWHRNTMDEIVNTRSNLCAVVENLEGIPSGFMIFEIQADRFYILKMGVLKCERTSGLAQRLLFFLNDRLTPIRNKIEIDVRESVALPTDDAPGACSFFSLMGFKATGVRSEFFKVYEMDAQEPTHVEDSYNFVCEVSFGGPRTLSHEKRAALEEAGFPLDFVREFI